MSDNTPAVFCTPLSGKVISLKNVNDPIFSAGLLGEGCAIIPDDGKIVAPCDGIISVLQESKHAIGIKTPEGYGILIHIGLNTVALKGQHYDAKVQKGDSIKCGDHLLSFDLEAVKAAGYDVTTPVVVVEKPKTAILEVVAEENSSIKHGSNLLKVSAE